MKKIGIILLLVLVLLIGVISPVIAYECTAFNKNKNKNVMTAVLEIKGLDKSKAIKRALNDEEVRKIARQLKDDGFTQDTVKVYKLSLKDGYKVLVVEIHFKSVNGERSIIYAYNPRTGDSVTILASGWDCVWCVGLLLGCAACAEACVEIGPACISCLILSCGGAVHECACCCCYLSGSSYCCGIC